MSPGSVIVSPSTVARSAPEPAVLRRDFPILGRGVHAHPLSHRDNPAATHHTGSHAVR